MGSTRPISTISPLSNARRRRPSIADVAAQKHRHRFVLRNCDHVDARCVALTRPDCRATPVWTTGPAVPMSTEMSNRPSLMVIVDPLGSDVGGRAVDPHFTMLLDARSDQRDVIAVGERVDLRAAGDADQRKAVLKSSELAGRLTGVGVEGRIVGRQQQAADVEHAGRADQDPARAVEPDPACPIRLRRPARC